MSTTPVAAWGRPVVRFFGLGAPKAVRSWRMPPWAFPTVDGAIAAVDRAKEIGVRPVRPVRNAEADVLRHFQHIGNRCSFIGELPAGPAVVLQIKGSVDAVGGQAF